MVLLVITTIFLFLCWVLCRGFFLCFLSSLGSRGIRVSKIISPRSLCPHCSFSIAWYDTRLAFSWLAIACPSCKKSISILYQSILTVLLFFSLYLFSSLHLWVPTRYFVPCFIFFSVLIVTTRYLPNLLTEKGETGK